MIEFCKGEYVNYRTSGVCLIEDIAVPEFASGGEKGEYYILRPVKDKSTTLFVPIKSEALLSGMRHLLAKEEIVAVLGVLDFVEMGGLAAISFLVFNLLCAPCFAAVGAIRREMNSMKWTLFAVGYQTVLAYSTSLCIYQIGMLVSGNFGWHVLGGIASISVILLAGYLIFRPCPISETVKEPALK